MKRGLIILTAILLAISTAGGCIYFGPERPRETGEPTVSEAPQPFPTAIPTKEPSEGFTVINRCGKYVMICMYDSTYGFVSSPVAKLMNGASAELGFDEIGCLPGRNCHIILVTAGEDTGYYAFYNMTIGADNTVEITEENGKYYLVFTRADGCVQRCVGEDVGAE